MMFFIIASAVMLFMALFTSRLLLGRRLWVVKGFSLFALMFLAFAARLYIRSYGHNDIILLTAWLGNISIGLVSILFAAALIKLAVDIIGFTAVKTSKSFSPSRRVFLTRTVGSALAFTAVPMAGYGVYRAVGSPVVKRVEVSKKGLHSGLEGFKMVQLTDIHVGPTVGVGTVRRAVEMTNELNPDAVLITGDIVDGSAKFIADYITPLKDLKSTYGTFFVTGNHEYYSGADAWIRTIQNLGITVLENSSQIIDHNGAKLLIAGIPDIHSDSFGHERYNPGKAKITDSDYDFSVIMSHRPEIADEIAEHGYDLQVSGHTHGGQYFPWNIIIHFFHKYVRGLYKVKDMHLYVSQGTAYWGPPIRIGAESEITEITITV